MARCCGGALDDAWGNMQPLLDWSVGGVINGIKNCIGGSTRLPTPTGFVRVDELEVGMQVLGITADGVQNPSCSVVGIGANGRGPVYGNYTAEHFILNEQGMVVEHGTTADERIDSLFDVLTDCPFGFDEAGVKYSAMANYYSMQTHEPSVSFDHHLVVYEVLLGLVRKTGSFWLFSGSYENITDAKLKRGELIDLMMECLHFGADGSSPSCVEMEAAAKLFVDEQFPSTGGRRALLGDDSAVRYSELIHTAFPKLGDAQGESGTAMYALREEVKNKGNKVPAYAAALIAVAGVAVAALVAFVFVCKGRKQSEPTVVAEPPSGSAAA